MIVELPETKQLPFLIDSSITTDDDQASVCSLSTSSVTTTSTTDDEEEPSPRVVSFATDLVTDVWTRERTPQEDVSMLFYSSQETQMVRGEQNSARRRPYIVYGARSRENRCVLPTFFRFCNSPTAFFCFVLILATVVSSRVSSRTQGSKRPVHRSRDLSGNGGGTSGSCGKGNSNISIVDGLVKYQRSSHEPGPPFDLSSGGPTQ